MISPTIIETIARALDDRHPIGCSPEAAAKTAVEAISQAGFAIVPIEPSEAMIDAGYNSEDRDGWSGPTSCWQRMIQAGKVKP